MLLEDLSGTVVLDQDFSPTGLSHTLNDPPTGYLILWAWAVSGEGYYGPFQIEVIEIPEEETDLPYPPGQVRNLRTSASSAATCDHGPIEGCRQPTTATFTGPAGGASPTQYRVDLGAASADETLVAYAAAGTTARCGRWSEGRWCPKAACERRAVALIEVGVLFYAASLVAASAIGWIARAVFQW